MHFNFSNMKVSFFRYGHILVFKLDILEQISENGHISKNRTTIKIPKALWILQLSKSKRSKWLFSVYFWNKAISGFKPDISEQIPENGLVSKIWVHFVFFIFDSSREQSAFIFQNMAIFWYCITIKWRILTLLTHL